MSSCNYGDFSGRLDNFFKSRNINYQDIQKAAKSINAQDATCGPDTECGRQKRLRELLGIKQLAEMAQNIIPEIVHQSRRNYLVFRDGEYSYNVDDINELKRELVADISSIGFNDKLMEVKTFIGNYNSLKTYESNMREWLDKYQKENDRLRKIIAEDDKTLFTNDRRYHYYSDSLTWQNFLNKMIEIAYWVIMVFYVGYFLLYQKQYTNRINILVGVLFAVIPFIIYPVLTFELDNKSIRYYLDRFVRIFTTD